MTDIADTLRHGYDAAFMCSRANNINDVMAGSSRIATMPEDTNHICHLAESIDQQVFTSTATHILKLHVQLLG